MVETNGLIAELTDIVAPTPHLKDYILRREDTTNATLTGWWVSTAGHQIGAAVTGTVTSTAQQLADILGAIPVNAAGFVGRLTGARVIYSVGLEAGVEPSAIVTDMGSNPTYYPVMEMSDTFRLGRA